MGIVSRKDDMRAIEGATARGETLVIPAFWKLSNTKISSGGCSQLGKEIQIH